MRSSYDEDFVSQQHTLGASLLRTVPPPRSLFGWAAIVLVAAIVVVGWVAVADSPETESAWWTLAPSFGLLTIGAGLLLEGIERRRNYVMLLHGLSVDVQAHLRRARDRESLLRDALSNHDKGEPDREHRHEMIEDVIRLNALQETLLADVLQYRAALIATGALREAEDLDRALLVNTDDGKASRHEALP